jgi:hypothetical protein
MDDINIPVDVRTHEAAQAREFALRSATDLRNAEQHERADTLERIYQQHLMDIEDSITMSADDWRTFISECRRLDRTEGLRCWWFRRKLAKRLDERMENLS